MSHLDGPLPAFQLIPGLDLTQEHVGDLLLRQLESGTIGLVVGHGDRPTDNRDLHHSPGYLGGLRGLNRFIGGSEVDRACDELPHPCPRPNRLIIHFDSLGSQA